MVDVEYWSCPSHRHKSIHLNIMHFLVFYSRSWRPKPPLFAFCHTMLTSTGLNNLVSQLRCEFSVHTKQKHINFLSNSEPQICESYGYFNCSSVLCSDNTYLFNNRRDIFLQMKSELFCTGLYHRHCTR